MNILKALIAAVLILPINGLACTFDSDCSRGSKCEKQQGAAHGICVVDISRSSRKEQQPGCSFDSDCSQGNRCAKDPDSDRGVCVADTSPGKPEQGPNACSFDSDCKQGARCDKEWGARRGVCVSDLSPGKSNESQPDDAIKRPYESRCSVNTDCGAGQVCVQRFGLGGVCEGGW